MNLLKKHFKALATMIVLCLCLTAVPVSAKTSKLKLNTTKITVYAGGSYNLKVKNLKKGKKIRWTISNKKIATVKNGKVKAKKIGTVTVTAKTGNKKMKCKIKVVAALNRSDFAANFSDAGKSYTNCIDYFIDGGYPTDYIGAEPGDKTTRGITIGDSKAKVIKAYGYQKPKAVKLNTAVIYSLFNDIDISSCSYYCEYKYKEKGITYQLIFFFNSKDKVDILILGKGL